MSAQASARVQAPSRTTSMAKTVIAESPAPATTDTLGRTSSG